MFEPEDLPALLALVTRVARLRMPRATYLLNSDVIWRLAGSRGDLRLWFDSSGLAGFAWFSLIEPSTCDVRPDLASDRGLASDMLAFLISRRREFKPTAPWLLPLRSMADWEQALDSGAPLAEAVDRVLLMEALDRDSDRIAFLESNGFTKTDHFAYYLTRSLDAAIPEPALPDGWRIRHIQDADIAARIAVHRASWHRSQYSQEQYVAIRTSDEYDPELDLVAESPTGEFASYAIGWIDHRLALGSFEPVGTPPAWRRKGLARAVQYEGLRRMKAKGARTAKIGTAAFNERAFGLYSSCGFEIVDRNRTFAKPI